MPYNAFCSWSSFEVSFCIPHLHGWPLSRRDKDAPAQLETLRQQLAAHIEHTKEMRRTLGVAIDCKATTKSLEHIDKQIAAHRARLRVLSSKVKGLSLEQASMLCIAPSDKTFANRDQLVAFVGLDVRVRQSGKWTGRQVISKRGNGYLRKVLFQIGWSLYMNNDEYRTVYERMRERGKNHKTCIIAVARKFLRLLFAFYWHCVEAARLALPLRPVPGLGQVQDPGSCRRATRPRGRVESITIGRMPPPLLLPSMPAY
jgi:hypothetical protein